MKEICLDKLSLEEKKYEELITKAKKLKITGEINENKIELAYIFKTETEEDMYKCFLYPKNAETGETLSSEEDLLYLFLDVLKRFKRLFNIKYANLCTEDEILKNHFNYFKILVENKQV